MRLRNRVTQNLYNLIFVETQNQYEFLYHPFDFL